MAKKLAVGTVARCKAGQAGLITKVSDSGFYNGVCLDCGHAGRPWQSIAPERIGTLDEWVQLRAEAITNA